MKKIAVVIGTRPEAIKLCPLVLALQQDEYFEVRVCSTGQHREMLQQVLETFGVVADFDLQLMARGQSLGQVTARATEGLDRIYADYRPDVAIVQGDTTSAFVGALVAHYHRIGVAHVEAGLRTGNKFAPFPEEMNRRLVGRLADLHFAPTQHAAQSLLDEGVTPETVFVTGNTVIDALFWVREKVVAIPPETIRTLQSQLADRPMVLITGHRRESFGTGFEDICQAIKQVAEQFPHYSFVYPVHLNPNVQEPVHRILGNQPRVHLIEPLSYEPFVWLMNRSTVVLTDSGGVQEEAPSLGKPVLVMRETTERPEGISAGNAKLVGVKKDTIVRELSRLLSDEGERNRMASVNNPYGDGTSCQQIARVLKTGGVV